MRKVCIALIGALFLSSCGDNKTSPAKTELESVPDSLGFVAPTPGKKLSKADVAQLKTSIGNRSTTVVPDLALVFSSKASKEEVRRKELELQSLDKNSYALLKDLQKDCGKNRPTTSIRATFPTDGDFSTENLRNGDSMSYNTEAALYGDKCPVKLDAKMSMGADVVSVDSTAKTSKAKGEMSYGGSVLIQSPKYAEILKMKGLILSTNISGVHVRQDANNKALVKYSVKGKYISLTDEVPYDASVTSLIKQEGSSAQQMETIVKMVLQNRQNKIDIDIYTKKTSSADVTRYFVNGHEMSAAEFGDVMGDVSPASEAQKTMSAVLN